MRQASKEETQVVNKIFKKCASNNLRDMQIKTTLKFCLIPVRLTFIQKSRTKKEERNTSSCLFPHSTSKMGLMQSRNFPTVGDKPITQITVLIHSSATLGKQLGCERLLVVEQRSCLFRKNQKLSGGSWKDIVLSGQDVGKEEPLFTASGNEHQ